ncbi:protein translocase subunit SecD [Rheinheimera aquimaris]|uniref:protein translocase subunit SecD n=1 Tax=Rheinheimera aquimaris TaxID=412437 RepID=UPI000E8C055C|nr:protein translocase subunit SecD [Rheinheimera aquimaris]MCD1599132.1 protein translocase subunit SecD [Rheinheimera aquimaris]HBN89667.1 protein translocase subunit SecD [Rheinheimera sp.]
MLNKNPAWRYVAVLGMLLLALLYALPNLYSEDPALNISATRGGTISAEASSALNQQFAAANLVVKAQTLTDNKLLIRFANTDAQLKAREIASRVLGDKFVVALDLASATPAWLQAIGAEPMKLGLDLRGGVHFLMAVDMKAAIDKNLTDLAQTLRSELRDNKLRYRSVQLDLARQKVVVNLRSTEDLSAVQAALKQYDHNLQLSVQSDGLAVQVALSEPQVKQIREYALAQNITIIRNRVNELGVAEPLVQRQGADRIVVQLPGVQDTAKAKEILGATATLEFRLVDEQSDVAAAQAGRVSPDGGLYHSRDGRALLLEKTIMLTGEHITGASSGYDEYGRPQVNIKLDTKGGLLMSAGSKDAVGRRMASVFIEYKPGTETGADGNPVLVKQQEVINDATISQRLGRDFVITGLSSPSEAQNLATLLRAGALIAPVQIIEERTIGPSLGQENISLGMTAIVWGMAAVLLFMLVYYKAFGLVANIALVANLVLIVGVLSMIPGATLTLPGMAGIVLTVGMAVDANVLIFERIREELAEGRSVQQAIHLGYDRAFATIADSNITTLLVALILFSVGTGPVKGFAVTLAIGIITSIFTAVVGTRLLVNLWWGGRRLQSLPV